VPRATTIQSLADIAEDQWGFFTRRQAEATGMAWTTLARLAKDGAAERVAHGVYRLRGNTRDANLDVCAAWLQLAPDTMVWDRTPEQAVICRLSAAAVYGLWHPQRGIHQFTLPIRRQSRRRDIKLYKGNLADAEFTRISGLLVTTPSRIVADLLDDGEDLCTISHIASDALREAKTSHSDMACAVAPNAVSFGFAAYDGPSLLEWLLSLPRKRLPGFDAAMNGHVTAARQFLLTHERERPADDVGGTTIRLMTVVRQGRTSRTHRDIDPPLLAEN
jgi:hypothetical protein